jgi:hypothetical protein
MAHPERPNPPPALLPAGQRWGSGSGSLAPYLREAWSMRPRNPVFTPDHIASLVWPRPVRAKAKA